MRKGVASVNVRLKTSTFNSAFNLKTVRPHTEVFCKGYDYREKAALSKEHWNPKKKMGATAHFFRGNSAFIILKSFK